MDSFHDSLLCLSFKRFYSPLFINEIFWGNKKAQEIFHVSDFLTAES